MVANRLSLSVKGLGVNNSAIIRDVGLTIANVLTLGLKNHKIKANVHQAPPQRVWFEKKAPAVGLYLVGLDCHQYTGERPQEDLIQEERPDGSIAEYFVDPPLTLSLEYLMTTWGKDVEEEALLLGIGMKIMLECPMLEAQHIVGESFTVHDRVQIQSETNIPLEKRALIFQGFGEPLRGAAFYKIPVQLFSERRSPEVRRVITRHIGVTDKQTGRRLR